MKIINLLNGETEITKHNDELIELVKIHMGYDMSAVFRELIEEADGNKLRVYSDLLSYEMSLDDNRSTFNDIYDILKLISTELNKTRINRKELMRCIVSIDTLVSAQL
ncbi:hypothetical protein [Paenibacillus tianjinensis]|uniref:Uncharacterized protein n=1 Tax=Paenibacillus tianjinensis TaxID=2810347 RepID=A0ABX7L7Y1_9BACL|nr:hypothetical protein [Paenibacillus tianjinensis]QSF43451.1 hypothetical protein JRJ22_19500 [Paenibacillus tianjinensis]